MQEACVEDASETHPLVDHHHHQDHHQCVQERSETETGDDGAEQSFLSAEQEVVVGGGGARSGVSLNNIGCHVDRVQRVISRYYQWTPPLPLPAVSPPTWHCQVCDKHFNSVDTLASHFHILHLNPHHLDPELRRKYSLSNFLVNKNEDLENKTEWPGLFRCEECFNVFNEVHHLKQHRLEHFRPAMVVSKYSREDFEDVSPRKRKRKSYKDAFHDDDDEDEISRAKKLNNNVKNGERRRVRKRVKQTKFTHFYSDPDNSDSDYDGDHIIIDTNKKIRENRSRRGVSRKSQENPVESTKERVSNSDESAKQVKQVKTNNKHPKVVMNGHRKHDRSKVKQKWRLNVVDHSKLHHLVKDIIDPHDDFLCLHCSQTFQSYSTLRLHKSGCNTSQQSVNINCSSKSLSSVSQEKVSNNDDNQHELFKYVTGQIQQMLSS